MPSDRHHPFFRPKWRRIAIVIVCIVWTVLEWLNGQSFWGMIALGITGYAVWTFLISYDETIGEDTG